MVQTHRPTLFGYKVMDILRCLFCYVFLCFLLHIFACISISHLPTLASMDHIMSQMNHGTGSINKKENPNPILIYGKTKEFYMKNDMCVERPGYHLSNNTLTMHVSSQLNELQCIFHELVIGKMITRSFYRHIILHTKFFNFPVD